MQITNHKLDGLRFKQAKWMGGVITPEIVVLHDTASRLDPLNAANYLADNDAKVSVHFVLERDGTITQQVQTNRAAWHAGKSTFQGRDGCNNFSVGIEIVNPGRMTRTKDGFARTWWGGLFDAEGGTVGEIEEVTTPEHGAGLWMAYTEEQIEALLELLPALFAGIPTLRDITTHWYISPGRKVDTNPLFPLEHIRAKVLGRDDPADIAAEDASEPEAPYSYVEVETRGDNLNMRRWPSFNPNVLAAIPDGTPVPVLRRGMFGGREWLLVQYGGREGWIVARYAAPVTVS
ncbi:N-acetylmuramoyl-L-alanine amidase [Oceanicola sp. S124]|uniref:N-acetylmuramoyl-L-alanine amidase n=1 Tax=Oceanicola sp. S124 TaxID=1042378 RepID=UPI0002558654|nr:N-acetylmuramoyl-L-alanine amidase [Oceanicola sp. S124]